jgi:hypothetical protein
MMRMFGLDATLTTAIRDARGLVLTSTGFQVKILHFPTSRAGWRWKHELPTSYFDEIE